jgi:hypothetical protein
MQSFQEFDFDTKITSLGEVKYNKPTLIQESAIT